MYNEHNRLVQLSKNYVPLADYQHNALCQRAPKAVAGPGQQFHADQSW